MARLTVRARVTLLATSVVLVVLVVGGIGLVLQQRRTLTDALDETLEARAEELAEEASNGRGPDQITGLGDDDAVAQVIVGDEVVGSSENVEGQGPIVSSIDDESTRTITGPVEEDDDDGEDFRVAVATEGDATAIVASPLDDVDESVEVLAGSLVLGIPIVVGALALVVWWVVGRALRPVEAIRAEVASIGGRELHRRVPVPAGNDEIARLAETMNDMLERVDDAAQRQRRFVADASHELRSPLTRMRTELEVDLAHPEQADLRSTHESVLDETIGLQRLADDLLLVARSDERSGDAVRTPVDLDDVVLRAARRLRADDRVRVDLSGVSAAQVLGDADHLRRLVGNLADNAVRHARTTVTVGLATRGSEAVLVIADDGPGVPEADRERIFERFARVDAARTAGDGGTGLGLAIARDIAESHGGTLALDPEAPGATFVLTLPAAPTS